MWFYERDFLSFPMRKVAENSLCRLKRNTKHFIMCTLLSGLEFNHPHIKTHITILAYYWPPATACGIDTNNNKCLLIVLHWTPGPISPRIKRQEPEAENFTFSSLDIKSDGDGTQSSYKSVDSTKSPASAAGNVIVPRLMSGECAKSCAPRSAGFHSLRWWCDVIYLSA